MDEALYYQEKGSGRPLILLHGNGEDGSYFKNQLEYFSGSRRVIAVDTRGHGRSPRGTAEFTIRQFAEDLKGLMVNEPDIKPEELRSIKVPALVIAGTRDMVKRSHTELIAENIPGVKLAIIKGDHFIANKEPERFNKEVDGFLQETREE